MPDDLNRFTRDLFDGLPARYDLLAEILSFGQNGQWRSAMTGRVTGKVPPNSMGLHGASGHARVPLRLAEGTREQVIGVNRTEQMLRQGQRRVAAAGMRDRIT